MSEWQPIETAPKDGTLIICAGEGWVEVCSWRETKYHGAGWLDGHDERRTEDYASRPMSGITHWMPLPSPPNPAPSASGTP